jgi:hypothetical protein
MSEPQSIKEYWANPKHNRRRSAGRRESDYTVCPYHDGKIEQDEKDKEHLCSNIKSAKEEHEADMGALWGRINQLESRIVGKWTFGIMVSIFLAMFTLFGALNFHLFNVIKTDLAKHIEIFEQGK